MLPMPHQDLYIIRALALVLIIALGVALRGKTIWKEESDTKNATKPVMRCKSDGN